jgi:threonine aldolase
LESLVTLKYLFLNDYSEGAHPRILEALARTNLQQEIGYERDSFCLEAERLILERLDNPNAAVHFVHSGGMANLVALASMLGRAFETVIAPETAHIHVHEGGAIEAMGHKISLVPSADGKLAPEAIRQVMDAHLHNEHRVLPKVVSLTHATELGTLYTRAELEDIAAVCREFGLYIYVDGARMGSALTAEGADITLADLSRLVDIFTIGGTKNGALLGEVIVITNPALQDQFRRHIRQRAAHTAKGRIIGVQFVELFRDDLYFDLARHAGAMAQALREGITQAGYVFHSQSASNLSFPILPNAVIDKLHEKYAFYVWRKLDTERSIARLVTSWATPESKVASFLDDLHAAMR